MGIVAIFASLLKKRGSKSKDPLGFYLNLAKKEPGNAKAHLKLAEIYQKKGDKKKATSEYLIAAEIFLKNQFYARAMAIYKQVPKQDPFLDHVYLKIADIYRKMGFLGDAFAQYRILAQHYDRQGKKDKALEVLGLMADMDPRKTDLKEKIQEYKVGMSLPTEGAGLGTGEPKTHPGNVLGDKKEDAFFDLIAELESVEPPPMMDFKEIYTLEKVYGFEEIFRELKETSGPSAVDPNFNYNLGVASREMGFLDDAIEQFQIALEKGQNPLDAATMLGLCNKEKGHWGEAAQALQRALKMEGISRDRLLEVKYELGLVYKEQGKAEEALGLLREISAVDQKFRDTKDKITRLMGDAGQRGKALA